MSPLTKTTVQSPPLLVVILNYRTAHLTIDCLRSLAPEMARLPKARALVVENGSGDDSASRLAAAIAADGWGGWAALHVSPRNLGFAGGNNLALRMLQREYADAGYVLLLNSDTLVRPGVLDYCLGVMQRESDIGMMSCLLLNEDNTPQNTTRRFPSPIRQTICSFGLPWLWPKLFGWANVYDVPDRLLTIKRDCDWLAGAFMLIRRSALDRVGLLDETFFFYGEDIDFCFRFREAGYRVHYDPGVAIVHIGGGSSDPTRMPAKLRSICMWQARYLFQRKCYGRLAAWWIRTADIVAFGLRELKMLCSGRRNTDQHRAVSGALMILLRPLRP